MATATIKGFTFSNTAEVLALVAAGKLVPDEAVKALALVNPTQRAGELSCRVSQAGAVSVYGLQRMPVTLYAEQWERLEQFIGKVRSFVEDNMDALVLKSDTDETKAAKAKHPKRVAAAAKSAESAKKRAAA